MDRGYRRRQDASTRASETSTFRAQHQLYSLWQSNLDHCNDMRCEGRLRAGFDVERKAVGLERGRRKDLSSMTSERTEDEVVGGRKKKKKTGDEEGRG